MQSFYNHTSVNTKQLWVRVRVPHFLPVNTALKVCVSRGYNVQFLSTKATQRAVFTDEQVTTLNPKTYNFLAFTGG